MSAGGGPCSTMTLWTSWGDRRRERVGRVPAWPCVSKAQVGEKPFFLRGRVPWMEAPRNLGSTSRTGGRLLSRSMEEAREHWRFVWTFRGRLANLPCDIILSSADHIQNEQQHYDITHRTNNNIMTSHLVKVWALKLIEAGIFFMKLGVRVLLCHSCHQSQMTD